MRKYDENMDSDVILELEERRKKLMIFAVVAVLVIAVVVIAVVSRINVVNSQKSSTIEREIFDNNEKIADCKKRLTTLLDSYADVINGDPCIIMAFSELGNGAVEDTINEMSKYGYKGVIVLKNGLIPGEEGAISRANYDKLIAAGWEVALGSDSTNKLSGVISQYMQEQWVRYVDNSRKKFADAGIAFPKAYCSMEGEDADVLSTLVIENGFETLLQIGDNCEEDWFSGEGYDKNTLQGFQADYECKSLAEPIAKFSAKGYSTVLYFDKIDISYPQNYTNIYTSISRFRQVLQNISTSGRAFRVLTIGGFKQYQAELDKTMTGKRQEYIQKRDVIILEMNGYLEKIEKLQSELK